MKLNQELINAKIADQKRAIAHFKNETDEEKKEKTFGFIDIIGEEIAIAVADFKCQQCGDENIQVHHVLTKYMKRIFKEERYKTQRHYWANIAVLCPKHHQMLHKEQQDGATNAVLCINESKIKELKERYYLEDGN